MARPIEYNESLSIEICELVANGLSIIKALDTNKRYPVWSTFRKWKRENESLQTHYTNAIQDKADFCLFEIDEICKEMK